MNLKNRSHHDENLHIRDRSCINFYHQLDELSTQVVLYAKTIGLSVCKGAVAAVPWSSYRQGCFNSNYTNTHTRVDDLLEKKNCTDLMKAAGNSGIWRTLRRDCRKPTNFANHRKENDTKNYCKQQLNICLQNTYMLSKV